jgi:hypothetical protein
LPSTTMKVPPLQQFTTLKETAIFFVCPQWNQEKKRNRKRKLRSKPVRRAKLIPTGCFKKSRTSARAEGVDLPNYNLAGTTCVEDACFVCMKELDGDAALNV